MHTLHLVVATINLCFIIFSHAALLAIVTSISAEAAVAVAVTQFVAVPTAPPIRSARKKRDPVPYARCRWDDYPDDDPATESDYYYSDGSMSDAYPGHSYPSDITTGDSSSDNVLGFPCFLF